MSKLPVKREPSAPQVIDVETAQVIESPPPRLGAFSFSYSYTEITAVRSKAQVKSRRIRYENGKLSNERFDGEFDRGVYDKSVADAQRAFADQASLMLRTFASFFTLPSATRRDRD